MITPDEIRAKADRLYPLVVNAWLRDEPFFPHTLRANLERSRDFSQARAEHQALMEQSKHTLGFGYSVVQEKIASRRHATQNFAVAITFDTAEDLLRLIRKQHEFRRVVKAANLVRQREPDLHGWVQSQWRQLLSIDAALPQLLDVVAYLKVHPRPGCFIRELPLAISTKLVEQHANVLGQWLDILTPHAVDVTFDHKHFAERYGFRAKDDQLWLRILDTDMLSELQCPGTELAMPRATLEGLPVRDAHVIIVENKINVLTLPPLRRTVAVGGLGNGVPQLFKVSWIEQLLVTYWGDIDIEGFRILARVREKWPQTKSFMMDNVTLDDFANLVIPGNAHDAQTAAPAKLNDAERATFERCRDECLRLEQERIPQAGVNERVADVVQSGARWAGGPVGRWAGSRLEVAVEVGSEFGR